MRITPCPLVLALLAIVGCGSVERTITVESQPSGALVYLNGREVGRTPVTTEFTWYGTYDLTLRKEGYETLKTTADVNAPVWQWVPIDLAVQLLPIDAEDPHRLAYELKPTTEQQTEPRALIERAENFSSELRATRRPTTAPTSD